MTKLTSEQWVQQYASSHTNAINKATHMVGIPMIALSVALFILSLEWAHLFWPALGLFVMGWVLQFIGHAFEGKRPEFMNDWRFLFVGLRWWIAKMRAIIARQI